MTENHNAMDEDFGTLNRGIFPLRSPSQALTTPRKNRLLIGQLAGKSQVVPFKIQVTLLCRAE